MPWVITETESDLLPLLTFSWFNETLMGLTIKALCSIRHSVNTWKQFFFYQFQNDEKMLLEKFSRE